MAQQTFRKRIHLIEDPGDEQCKFPSGTTPK